ncbi:hypothetical protein [Bradyrhizobium sp. CCBAU 53338]|uniref:hypothetical protein n=1 Tax=Bradyrhizobium sp. CCBAU 53338 TaxID=1325111 RepID=UPI00188C95E0|nr:hypothetical protein [Bradyrhizobium sp. CCBAU 53338]
MVGFVNLLALSVPLVAATITLFAEPTTWVDLIFDDAYYYLGVASNLAVNLRSMFAPPLDTNGYQPLWMAILAAASFLVRGDHHALAVVLHLLIFCVIGTFMFLSSRIYGKAWPAALTTIAFPMVSSSGLETVLCLPIALLYFRSDGWQRGTFATLLFLARLDAVGLIIGREIFQFAIDRRIDYRSNLLLAFAILTYLLLNYTFFGTPLPISGLAKAVGNRLGQNFQAGLDILRWAIAPTLALVIVSLAPRRAANLKHKQEISICMFAIAASAAYYSIFSGWHIWHWYAWPVALLFYFTLLVLSETKPGPQKWMAVFVLVLETLWSSSEYLVRYNAPILAAAHLQNKTPSWGVANVIEARQADSNAIFAMGDRAGSFGYFLPAGSRLIQTEAIVANVAYLNAIVAGRVSEFLADEGVTDLVVDRGKYWLQDGVYAVPEPIQALSARLGVTLFCFPASAMIAPLKERPARKIFKFGERTTCPDDAKDRFAKLVNTYGGIRRESLGHP